MERKELRRAYRRYDFIGNLLGFLTAPAILAMFFFGLLELTALSIGAAAILLAAQIGLILSDIQCRRIEKKERKLRRDNIRRYQFND